MAVCSVTSVNASLGDDEPPNGLSFCQLGLDAFGPSLGDYLKKVETITVHSKATAPRLTLVCKAIDSDVGGLDGANMVFNLATKAPNESGLKRLKRVLSLGVRPDVPNCWRELPLEVAFCQGKLQTAKALALCRPTVIASNAVTLQRIRSVIKVPRM